MGAASSAGLAAAAAASDIASVAAVAHRSLQQRSAEDIGRKLVRGGSFIDVKSAFDEAALRAAGLRVWRL